jgi:hypothetical protein
MRRNAPCHCGSNKRFKHCHGKYESEEPGQKLQQRRQEALLHERRLQQGFGKAIQSYKLGDNRAVVVGRSLMVGKWPTFTNFVLEYFAERIGKQWATHEINLGEGGHPIGQWAVKMREQDARRIAKAVLLRLLAATRV